MPMLTPVRRRAYAAAAAAIADSEPCRQRHADADATPARYAPLLPPLILLIRCCASAMLAVGLQALIQRAPRGADALIYWHGARRAARRVSKEI